MGHEVASEDGGSPGRRRYHSPLRAQRAVETRATVIDAASRLFTTGGWVATGMRDVARDAGVSVETVYSHFPSKRKLLDAVIDHAVMGDSEPVAVAQRPEFVAMGQGRRSDRIAAAASIAAGINRRTARFAQLIREAATSDEEIAEVLRATRERQRSDVEAGVALILGRAPTGTSVTARGRSSAPRCTCCSSSSRAGRSTGTSAGCPRRWRGCSRAS